MSYSIETAIEAMNNHMYEDYFGLVYGIDGFETFPLALQEVLMDIRYNTGNVTRRDWKHLREAIDRKDLPGIIREIKRGDVGKDRELWAVERLRSIKEW